MTKHWTSVDERRAYHRAAQARYRARHGEAYRARKRVLRKLAKIRSNLSPAQAIQRPDSRPVGRRDSEANVSGNGLPWFNSTGAVTREERRRRRGKSS